MAGLSKGDAEKLTATEKTGKLFADGQQPNLYLRVMPSGTKTWVLREREGKRWHVVALGRLERLDPKQARLKAQATSAKRRATATAAAPATDMTVAQAAELWYAEQIVGGRKPYRRPEQVLEYIKHWNKSIGDVKLAKVTTRALHLLILDKQETAKNAANKLRAFLAKFFRYAVFVEWIERDPMERLTFRTVGTPMKERQRKLTDDEIRAAWNIPAPHGSLYRMLLASGQRLSEVLALATDSSTVRDGVWHIDENKSDRPHQLPMMPLMAEILASGIKHKRRAAAHHLWRDKMGGDATQHDIRRTVATRMAALGIDPYLIEHGLLNHARPKLIRTYQQPDTLPLMRAALKRWHAELLRIVTAA